MMQLTPQNGSATGDKGVRGKVKGKGREGNKGRGWGS